MKKILILVSILIATSFFAGCATPGGIVKNNYSGTSILDKIHIDMSQKQVEDLIGQPTDRKYYSNWTIWIPFYSMYGKGVFECAYYYKGLGEVVFSKAGGTSSVYTVKSVIYNPNESGYAK